MEKTCRKCGKPNINVELHGGRLFGCLDCNDWIYRIDKGETN